MDMVRLAKFRLLALTVVLGIAVASVAGITFSSTESKGVITAVRYSDAVRFTVQNEKVEIVRAEVFDLAGKRLFDSGPTMGNTLDWPMTTEAGERAARGVYLYVITIRDSGGGAFEEPGGQAGPGGGGREADLVSSGKSTVHSVGCQRMTEPIE